MSGPWEDYQNSQTSQDDGPWNDYAQQKKQIGLSDVIDYVKDKSGYNTSPIGLLEKGYEYAQKGANKLGEFTAEGMGELGYDPRIAGVIGTTVAMTPDILTSMGPSAPMAGSKFNPDMGKSARSLAERALGFTKRLKKTANARRLASVAADVALEEGIIPALGSPEVMLSRAEKLASSSGKAIGESLKKTTGNLSEVFDDLESLRTELTEGGLKEGLYKSTNDRINSIQETVVELMDRGEDVSGSTLTKLKNKLASKLNYFSDLESQVENKAIVRRVANKIREFVKDISTPEEYAEFLKNQRKFSAAETMKVGLDNEISSQSGNSPVSLLSVIPAAAQLGVGRPVQAAATLGMFEALKRRGTGIGANLLNSTNIYGNQISSQINAPLAGLGVGMGFTKRKKDK